jgi:hypothetical protein
VLDGRCEGVRAEVCGVIGRGVLARVEGVKECAPRWLRSWHMLCCCHVLRCCRMLCVDVARAMMRSCAALLALPTLLSCVALLACVTLLALPL